MRLCTKAKAMELVPAEARVGDRERGRECWKFGFDMMKNPHFKTMYVRRMKAKFKKGDRVCCLASLPRGSTMSPMRGVDCFKSFILQKRRQARFKVEFRYSTRYE